MIAAAVRQPVWSASLTIPVARRIPSRWHAPAMIAVKTVHTTAFLAIAGSILLFAWDGLRGRTRRRTVLAATVGLVETAIYASNNQVCPLTPLAEELGAASGTVTDIFLPTWLSQRIPVVGGAVLIAGVALNLRTWRVARATVPT